MNELQQAIELAQLWSGVIERSRGNVLEVWFEDADSAEAYRSRVEEATRNLTATRRDSKVQVVAHAL